MPVRNVLGVIPGATRPQERVVVGAHYDAWTYGASDNTSGWAAVMEIGRASGSCSSGAGGPTARSSWPDGAARSANCSTEWVEQFERDLARDAVAYANLDIAGGTSFDAAGVPQLDDALTEITKAVTDQRTGASVYDVWKGSQTGAPQVGRLGSGSDYTAFLDHVGVPSFQAGFTAPAQGGTYHSAYDDTYNTEHYLDPGYLGHAGSARVTGVSALRLANASVLPFRYSDYAAAVTGYVTELQRVQAETPGAAQVDLRPLLDAAASWKAASEQLEARADGLLKAGATDSGAIAPVNDALMRQERALTTSRGLPGRPWFRHQIYAPGLVTGYAAQFLPGMRDAVEQGDAQTAETYRDLLRESLDEATRLAKDAAT